MDDSALERARERLAEATSGRPRPAELEAVLERARQGLEELVSTSAQLESTLPEQIGAAVRDGVAAEAGPLGRQLAEVRGLMNQVVRRLERLEGDMLTERNARVDDLALLVDLIAFGWQGVDERLAQLEGHFQSASGAVVYRIEERRPGG